MLQDQLVLGAEGRQGRVTAVGGEGRKWGLSEATDIACEVVRLLDPACERIEVAGSIRRKCLEVGDLEIVVVPKTKIQGQQTLFGLSEGKRVSVLPHHLEVLMAENKLQRHPTDPKMGEKYMKLRKPVTADGEGVSVDIFAVTPPANFGVIYLIRTGGKEFNLWIIDQAKLMGMNFKDGQLLQAGRVIPCPEEQDVFRALRLNYIPPPYRSVGPEQRFVLMNR